MAPPASYLTMMPVKVDGYPSNIIGKLAASEVLSSSRIGIDAAARMSST
jgi:hypothetical protein